MAELPDDRLISDLHSLRERLLHAESEHAELIDRVRERHRASARNLVHYVALRGTDLRDLQDRLSDAGLSSLGRMEAGVLGHLDTVLTALCALSTTDQSPDDGPVTTGDPLTPAQGRQILQTNTEHLLGPARADRQTRIMVTMPSEAATDPDLVAGTVTAGMDLARINCAHDDESAWTSMIESLRSPGTSDGDRPAPLIAMDLAGPKLRTGPIAPGPQVLKVKPQRDSSGTVTAPSRVWLGQPPQEPSEGTEPSAVVGNLPLQDPAQARPVLTDLTLGDELTLTDARGSKRTLTVEALTPEAVQLTAAQTVYWATGTELSSPAGTLTVGELPAQEQSMRVREGEQIVLTRSLEPRPAVTEPPYVIGCTLPQVFEDIEPGHRVWIDDGKIGTVVESATQDEIRLCITSAGPNGAKLKAEKGINVPDTELSIPALTQDDLAHIPFVAAHADMVNLSFVRSEQDVAQLIDLLQAEGAEQVDITLKIETVSAFESLPRMLLEAMRWRDVGVMIARGDLAVEAGFERMAELQEEILWLCEAAHVPVIWATQVLESLAKSGLPSRAEITDAAMAQRAECVMLNKGPFITEAISALSDILTRMGGHTQKKRDMLRQLRSWQL
ncbi:pyruvate kinase [Micrococcus sp. IITD107]|uniref:pyruvate kinase n=1 Tax=Micrococcus sp. IITD107 TaxID=3342790 RepID=UPI0035BB625B